MINKKDPLIAAVQQVMQNSQNERNAVNAVNEKFGVTDRKALPHEQQSAWDTAYQTVLTEGVEALGEEQQLDELSDAKKAAYAMKASRQIIKYTKDNSAYDTSPAGEKKTKDIQKRIKGLQTLQRSVEKKKMEEEALDEKLIGNQPKIDANKNGRVDRGDFKLLKKGVRPMEEENAPKTDPYAEGQASSISTASPPKKEVTPADQSALKKKIMSIKEAKVNPYAVGMAAVKKSTGDEPPMEKKNIMKAHEIAKKIIAKKKMNESTLESIQEEIANNLAEQASYIYENEGIEGLNTFLESLTEEQISILQMNEGLWDSIKSAYNSVDSAVKSTTGSINRFLNNPQGIKSLPSYTPKTNDAITNMNKSTTQQGGNGTSGPNRGLGSTPAAPKASTPAAPKPKVKPAAPKTAPAAPKTAPAPKVAAPKEQGTPVTRMKNNRSIDKGNEVGPRAKYQGVGVTTGKTIKK